MIRAVETQSHHALPASSLAADADWDVWQLEDQWRCIHSTAQSDVRNDPLVCLELARRFPVPPAEPGLGIHQLDDGRLLCVRTQQNGAGKQKQRRVAVRVITPAEIAEILNSASDRIEELEEEVQKTRTDHAETIAELQNCRRLLDENRDQRTWLRDLAKNAELNVAETSVEQVARRVLPELQVLLRARSVVFIREAAIGSESSDGPRIWQTGDDTVPVTVCLSLLENLRDDALSGCSTRTFVSPQYQSTEYLGVISCAAVPVVATSMHIGWLMAFNKDLQLISDDLSSQFDDDYMVKASDCEFAEFDTNLMSAAADVMAAHGRNCRLFHEKEQLMTGIVKSLINTIEAKDPYTCGHSDRVAEYSRLIAARMGMDADACDRIYMTGLLHDVGKIGVPDQVLNKVEPLTPEEFEMIKQHPVIGCQILRHLDDFSYVLPGVRHHHEAVDGTGYPDRLSGSDIPLEARILAVADAYDAMTSDRPYRRGMPTERAEAILRDGAGQQWDRDCVHAFFKCIHGVRLIAERRHTSVAASVLRQRRSEAVNALRLMSETREETAAERD